MSYTESVEVVRDHLTQRRNVAADDRSLVEPCLEVADAECLVKRRHREDVARVQRGGFLGAGRALDVDDPLVGVSRELVEEARVKPGDTDEDEARIRVPPPHQLRRVQQVDIALVALLASDVQDERCVARDPVRRTKLRTVVRA